MSESLKGAIEEDLNDIRETIYVGIVGFTVLIWDHVITFDDEVELIWQGKKGLREFLSSSIRTWFIPVANVPENRYLTPLGFIVNLVAYSLRAWPKFPCQSMRHALTPFRCNHFVRYEGAMTVVGIQIVGLMMLIRVRAMYNKKNIVVAIVALLFAVWTAVNAWLLASAGAVNHSSLANSCSMVFNPNPKMMASASAWLPLLYDTVVFLLTLKATVPSVKNKQTGHVFRTLLANGLLYYSVICTVNLVLTIMIIQAPEGLKNISAQLELLLTVAMMSRITLNLRKQALYGPSPSNTRDEIVIYPLSFARSPTYSNTSIGSFRARPGSSLSIDPPLYHSRVGSSASANATRPTSFGIHDIRRDSPVRPRLSTIFSATSTPYARSSIDDSTSVSGHCDRGEREAHEMMSQEARLGGRDIEAQQSTAIGDTGGVKVAHSDTEDT
ncbi:hypothetical protein BV22DRAFT_1122838 [Leucogyrophana mollusca]|uniref:Uncharacterized protein n=1 Tax=Leucogyrophana mollusca TaxID=85980 RepID=A0ACB8B4Z7_9AGAM|nr:hypothetical protein BV22DRAFT_1122838 [Leucogyrophana mollusca]